MTSKSLIILALLLSVALPASARGRRRTAPATPSIDEEIYYANAYADHYGVPRALVYAIIRTESNWNPTAVSEKNAQGLMQLMPDTARRYGVRNTFSTTDNLSGGVRYLSDLIRQFGDFRLVVAAYYTGEHRIAGRGLKYSNADVTAYVKTVRKYYEEELEHEIAAR